MVTPTVRATDLAIGFFVGVTSLTTASSAAPLNPLPPMTAAVVRDDSSRRAINAVTPAMNQTTQSTPAERVERLRSGFGLSAEQLARLFGVSRRTVNNWIAGRPLSEENLRRLMRIESGFCQRDWKPGGTAHCYLFFSRSWGPQSL